MLRTEGDLVRALAEGCYTLGELYERAAEAGLPQRPGGQDLAQDGKPQWKHRVRSALQSAKRSGRARRVGDGQWVIGGTRTAPVRALFVVFADPGVDIELMCAPAAELLGSATEPISLVIADPPWGLDRDRASTSSFYGRNSDLVVDGYQEVSPRLWRAFCEEWMGVAHSAVAEHGYLAVITGPQQAAAAQIAAEDVGFTYVNSIVVTRTMPVRSTRRLAHAHHRVTLLCKGDLNSPSRRFKTPDDLPKARSGADYGRDVWDDVGDYRRPRALRYPNSQHPRTYMRLMEMCSVEGDLCADPFLGSGTAAVAALACRRRLLAGDVNPEAIRFTMGRVHAEALPLLAAAA